MKAVITLTKLQADVVTVRHLYACPKGTIIYQDLTSFD